MSEPVWRDKAIETLRAALEQDPRVVALGVFGSMAQAEVTKDRWSDVDLLVVVADEAFAAMHRTLEWIADLGETFVVRRNVDGGRATVMVVFADFRKIDVVIAASSEVERGQIAYPDLRILFSRDDALLDRLRVTVEPSVPDTISPLPGMIDTFWFLAYTAVAKAMRSDLLIALHLALDLHRMILVLGMMLRDRDLGTTVHRVGGARNDLAETHIDVTTRHDILALVERSGQVFDTLAAELDPTYRERSSVFRTVIDRARKDLAVFGK